MSEAIIAVETLGKCYRIKHQQERQRYVALRDVIATKFKGLFRARRFGPLTRATAEDFWALRNLSFEIKTGEVVGIIGRNGAGKSTLLKILSRITEPTEGRVRIKGRVASLLEVGTGFHPELTGRENIYLNGAILGMSRKEIRNKFDEIVAFAEIEKFLDTPVKRYSSGMYVRLAFAVAAHLEPEILIVDEVLAVGDAEFQRKCLGKMREVATGGRTVLFVSHNIGAVESLCQTGLLLHQGTLLARGTIQSVVQRYLQQATQLNAGECKTRESQGFKLTREDGWVLPIRCGDLLEIEFGVDAPDAITNLSCGFILKTASGMPLAGMTSKYPKAFGNGSGKGWKVTASLGRLPLNPGSYTVKIYLGKGYEDLAIFDEALRIEVTQHDVLGNGNGIPDSWGILHWNPNWTIVPAPALNN